MSVPPEMFFLNNFFRFGGNLALYKCAFRIQFHISVVCYKSSQIEYFLYMLDFDVSDR